MLKNGRIYKTLNFVKLVKITFKAMRMDTVWMNNCHTTEKRDIKINYL